ncbi:hypothetical protein DO021_14850 [Desulfobacter hydrogenophilus]|uniref:Uncharacterized protein n=1 Tax=Desulfobacter hydrogenophilus TaxID=2291 RepID=A0A328FCR5_9BACT|nr:hypothetical protein DO021_14850 [Desulfobacter hydrogenophilus]
MLDGRYKVENFVSLFMSIFIFLVNFETVKTVFWEPFSLIFPVPQELFLSDKEVTVLRTIRLQAL